MKKSIRLLSALAVIAVLASCSTGGEKTKTEKDTAKAKVEIATYSQTTKIPEGITTPNEVETSIGTLKFIDGAPLPETSKRSTGA